MCKESQKPSETITYLISFNDNAEQLYKNKVKRSNNSGDFLCKKIEQFDWPRKVLGQNSRTRLLNYLKLLNQFAFCIDAYPCTKTQFQKINSIQFWHIVDLILGITFGIPRYAWPQPSEWTQIYLPMPLTTCKKSTSYKSPFLI